MSNLSARLRKLETSRSGANPVTDAELAEAHRIESRHAWGLIKAAFERQGARPCQPPIEADAAPPDEAQLKWAAAISRRHFEHSRPGQSYEAHLNRIHELGQERLRELGWIDEAP